MMNVLTKRNNDESLEIIVMNSDQDEILYFDSISFKVAKQNEIEISNFKTISLNLFCINEIREEGGLDLQFLRVNDEIIIQIGWMPVDNRLSQYLKVFDKKKMLKNSKVYEEALSRFFDAELNGDIEFGKHQ